jgi:hypothetical protein
MNDFLFNPTGNLIQFDWVLFGIFGALLVLGIVELITAKNTNNLIVKDFHSRLVRLFFTIGILGAFWSGMRYLFVPYLGTRFSATLILAVGIVWSAFVIFYAVNKYGQARKEWEQRAMKEKYLR